MSGKITVQWAQLAPGLVPWWVGCQAVVHRAPVIYWQPVEDAVNERLDHDAGLRTWLNATGRDYIIIELGGSGLRLFEPGRITKFDDGGICYELEIPDAIAHSRDLAEVQDFLLVRTMAALAAIARRLRTAPPPTRAVEDLTGPPVPRGRVADIAVKHGVGRPLVLISPRHRHRPRFDRLRAALAAGEIDVDGGWAAYSVDPDTTRRGTMDTEFDFTGVARPLDPDILLLDTRIVCLLVAAADQPLPAQREQLEACAALVSEHVPVAARVSGDDSGVLWSATAIG